jgi:hypothetical protein
VVKNYNQECEAQNQWTDERQEQLLIWYDMRFFFGYYNSS